MRTTAHLRIGTLAIVVIAFWGVSTIPSDASHEFILRSDSDRALANWALARFDRAGLQLPPLSIAFHDDDAPCEGNFGYFRPLETLTVDVCGFNWNRFLVTPKRTILHELGHAWAHQNLTEETRLSFTHFRGLDEWDDDSKSWSDQGSEHTAEIIAWALMDEELRLSSIGDADPEVLVNAYELLTSHLPPPR